MYVKIQTEKSLIKMPDQYNASWDLRNDEETRQFCVKHDNWLELQKTTCPEYDPETQYATYKYVEQEGKAVQVWEIHDRPVEE